MLSVIMIISFGVPQNRCPSSLNAKYFAETYLEHIGVFFCEGVNFLESYATGA